MKILIIVLTILLLCSCYSSKKESNSFIGATKAALITTRGKPISTYTDSLGKRLVCARDRKLHNSKYADVVLYTTFFLNRDGNVYKWKTETVKTPIPTGKPSIAIEGSY